MSRIGIKPILIPNGVEIKIEEDAGKYNGQKIIFKGPLGELTQELRKDIKVKIEDNKVILKRDNESKFVKSLHGLYRTLINNIIEGVQKLYEKELEIVGIGYRAELSGSNLSLHLGATHPYDLEAPKGITFEVIDKVNIKVKGIDKQLVGQVAAEIRSFAKPEPYKGKGIRYKGEYVRRKAGKAAKVSSAGTE
jgi:large subunit ribosomal protein L6